MVFSSELNMAGNALGIFLIKPMVVSLDRRLIVCKFGQKNFDSVHTGGGQDPKRPEMAPARPRPKGSWPDAFF